MSRQRSDGWLTPAQASRKYGVPRHTIRRWIKSDLVTSRHLPSAYPEAWEPDVAEVIRRSMRYPKTQESLT